MRWKKHFTVYQKNTKSLLGNQGQEGNASRFQSWLPEVYTGMPNRVERYMQYDQMDTDSEINTALDTISEFSTQIDIESGSPFKIVYKGKPSDSEAKIIDRVLKQWCNLNDWDRRIFKTFRNVIKYGDQPFIRDPETWELYFVNPQDVVNVVVNQSTGKDPEYYTIKNLDLNISNQTATQPIGIDRSTNSFASPVANKFIGKQFTANSSYAGTGNTMSESSIAAEHIIHVALTEGMDSNWPFGNSILDGIFKVYKQKELLEDAMIIYRVQRAPERRIFYIDTGDMPPHKAATFLEKIKNEVHQKRIPNKTGGSQNVLDAQYNPLCLSLDTCIPLLDGRTLTLSELIQEYKSGKENWTYSCDPITGKILPGNITWAGITRQNAQVIKLHLSNGLSITLTPDHKIPVLGRGFVEAKDITNDDQLIGYFANTSTNKIYDYSASKWIDISYMVASFFKNINKHQEFTFSANNVGMPKTIIHHNDFNYCNNDPRNLQWMNDVDYLSYMEFLNSSNIQLPNIDDMHDKLSIKVTKVEWISELQHTGTITIDGNERWHPHHTFPVSAGIFVKNSILEDYFFAKSADGRGSSVEVLPGGSNLGEIDDLKFITDKLMRGLRIPSSYMSMGSEEGNANYNDGRVGTAFIQEFRFTQYCKRLQNTIQPIFDREFKRFIKYRGFNIDAGMFDIRFTEPQSFSQYRQIEIDGARANVFGQVQNTPYLSKRFMLKKYLGLSEAEILENERLYLEENPSKGNSNQDEDGLGDVGIRGGDYNDFRSFNDPVDMNMDFNQPMQPDTNVAQSSTVDFRTEPTMPDMGQMPTDQGET